MAHAEIASMALVVQPWRDASMTFGHRMGTKMMGITPDDCVGDGSADGGCRACADNCLLMPIRLAGLDSQR